MDYLFDQNLAKERLQLYDSIHFGNTSLRINIFLKNKNYEAFEYLITKNPELNDSREFVNYISRACERKDLETAKWLYSLRPEYHSEYNYERLFYDFFVRGNMDIIQWIYSLKPDINLNKAYLSNISSEGHIDLLKWIYSIDPDFFDTEVYTNGIIQACKSGHLEVVQWLYSINPDAEHDFERYFSYAIKNEQMKIVEWLFEVEPNINIMKSANYIFTYACIYGRLEAVKWIYENSPEPINIRIFHTGWSKPKKSWENFYEACKSGNSRLVKFLLRVYPEINYLDSVSKLNDYETPFYIASIYGHFNVLTYLYYLNPKETINKNKHKLNEIIIGYLDNPEKLDIIKWFYLVFPKKIFSTINFHELIEKGFNSGNFEFINWLLTIKPEMSIIIDNKKESLFIKVCGSGNPEFAKWMYNRYPTINIEKKNHAAFKKACDRISKKSDKSWDIVTWLILLNPTKYRFKYEHESWSPSIVAVIARKKIDKIEECFICHDAISTLITECGHQYCKKCIRRWLMRSGTCPYCREELMDDELYPINE